MKYIILKSKDGESWVEEDPFVYTLEQVLVAINEIRALDTKGFIYKFVPKD